MISPVEPVFIFGNIIFLNTLGHIQTDWKLLLTQFENRSKITNRSGIRFYGGEMDGHAKTTNTVLSPFCSSVCINLYSTLTGSFPALNWLYSYNWPPYRSYRMSSNNALGATRWPENSPSVHMLIIWFAYFNRHFKVMLFGAGDHTIALILPRFSLKNVNKG